MLEVNLTKLKSFLVLAKKNGYAGNAPEETIDRLKMIVFQEGEFTYTDKYRNKPRIFTGTETVLQNQIPIWEMNYFGKIISKKYTSGERERQIYDFLRKALLELTYEHPFRGPKKFKNLSFEYFNNFTGNIKKFSGRETIQKGGNMIYTLRYHGGVVNNFDFTKLDPLDNRAEGI